MNRTQRSIIDVMQADGVPLSLADFSRLQIGDSGLKKSLSALVAEGMIEVADPERGKVATIRYRLDPGQNDSFVGLHRWKLTELGEAV